MPPAHAPRVVRLNATLFPPSCRERELCASHCLDPVEVEANTPAEIGPHVEHCDALFVVSAALPAEVVGCMSRCRVISRLGTGTDKIDVDCATRNGIVVANVPDFCVEEQADHAFALLLALARKLPQMAERMARGEWRTSRRESETNRRLSSRVLGLVGFGSSARAVARRARAFGMRVLATRRNMAAPAGDAGDLGVDMVDLDTLLGESDYVSLHLPLTPETHHLFDGPTLRNMKPGAFLVNTSRGAIVDETELVAALQDGHLAGAGLDTFEQIDVHGAVRSTPRHPLLGLENVVLTPHVAGYSVEAMRKVAEDGVRNLVAVLGGRWPPLENVVNPGVTPRSPLES